MQKQLTWSDIGIREWKALGFCGQSYHSYSDKYDIPKDAYEDIDDAWQVAEVAFSILPEKEVITVLMDMIEKETIGHCLETKVFLNDIRRYLLGEEVIEILEENKEQLDKKWYEFVDQRSMRNAIEITEDMTSAIVAKDFLNKKEHIGCVISMFDAMCEYNSLSILFEAFPWSKIQEAYYAKTNS